MASTSKLIGIALTGTGVVGAGVGTYYALKSDTPEVATKSKISELITDSGRTLLDNDATNLEIKFYAYGKLKNKPTLSPNNKEALKQWCQGVINEEIEISKKTKNNDFQMALKLCTKPTNREKLEKNNKTIAVKDDWAGIQGKYILEGNSDNLIPTLIKKEAVTAQDISTWCSKTLEEEILGTNKTYDLTVKWCTKLGT